MRAGELIKTTLQALFPQALYADMLPENCAATVACVYQYISAQAQTTLDGGHTGEDACRIQIDIYAPQLSTAFDKADAVIVALEAQTTRPALYLGKRTIPEPETRRSRVSLDFSIWERAS